METYNWRISRQRRPSSEDHQGGRPADYQQSGNTIILGYQESHIVLFTCIYDNTIFILLSKQINEVEQITLKIVILV